MSSKVRIRVARVTAPPFFAPWIGDAYRRRRDDPEDSCCDGRWHIMGESHYGNETDRHADATIGVVQELAIPGYRFFDTLLSVVTGKPKEALDRAADWSNFAFSNFVQDILPDENRRPERSNWQSGREAFFGQLSATRPKQLLVVGREQWGNLPDEGYNPVQAFRVDPQGELFEDVGIYAYQIGQETMFTIATWIYHPSSRGRLNIARAAERVRAVTMVSCNILSALQRDEEGWFYESD